MNGNDKATGAAEEGGSHDLSTGPSVFSVLMLLVCECVVEICSIIQLEVGSSGSPIIIRFIPSKYVGT